MQTLVAYAVADLGSPRVRHGLSRVEHHYGALAGTPLVHAGLDGRGVGLHAWDAGLGDRRWPTWQSEPGLGVVTVNAPVGYERLVGDLPPERAAGPLLRTLLARPEAVL